MSRLQGNLVHIDTTPLTPEEQAQMKEFEELEVAAGCPQIPENFFKGCKARKIRFLGKVRIDEDAFAGCPELEKLVFDDPDNVCFNILGQPFIGCDKPLTTPPPPRSFELDFDDDEVGVYYSEMRGDWVIDPYFYEED